MSDTEGAARGTAPQNNRLPGRTPRSTRIAPDATPFYSTELLMLLTAQTMDALDSRLVTLLQQNCRLPLQTLADTLGVGARTVAKRIAALEQSGMLELIAVTDIHAAGNEYIVQVGVHVDGCAVIDVAQQIARLPQIIHINIVLGRFDIELIAIARDSQDLSHFLNDELRAIAGVAQISPSLALDVRKFQSNWMAFDDVDEAL